MNHAHIRAFHAVAQEASFTRAARSLKVSQPTLSAQVRALEDTFGVRLFDRIGRQIHLTELGDRLYQITIQLFQLQDQARSLLTDTRDLAHGRLTLAADSPYHMMGFIKALQLQHPGLNLSVTMGNADEVLKMVTDFRADLGFITGLPTDKRLHVLPFYQDRLVVIVHTGHPLAGSKSITLQDLSEHRVILRESQSKTRTLFEKAVIDGDFEMPQTMEITTREALREAVAEGLGVGIIFEREVGRDPHLSVIPIAGPDVTTTVSVVTIRDQRRLPPVRAAVRLAEETAMSQ